MVLLCKMLMFAALASMLLGARGSKYHEIDYYASAIAIFVLVIINAGIAAWTEHNAGDALAALSSLTPTCIGVLRNGDEARFRQPQCRRVQLQLSW